MKYIDDDMDELFNKAGKQYPLKTEPKNWDAVRAALGDEKIAAVPGEYRSARYRRLLPLLLLLLIPAAYLVLDKGNVTGNKITAAAVAVKNTEKVMPQVQSDDMSGRTKNKNGQSSENITIERSKVVDIPQEHTDRNVESEKSGTALRGAQSSSTYESDIAAKPNTNLKHNNNFYPVSAGTKSNEGEQPLSGRLKAEKAKIWFDKPYESITSPSNTMVLPNESASVPKTLKIKNKIKGLYYGVAAAPDFTTIKGQSVKGMGYSAGIILGYDFNPKLAIEGGVLWSEKKYFTDGKHFSKGGANIPWGVDVLWLDGGCEMLEFPIIARYSFSAKRNSFFVSGGLTSSIMKTEDYDYGAVAGPGGNYYEGYRTYDRSGDHLFANMQLSAGYKFGITSKLNVRIEPYVKAPLKKVGIGKMPITSTGLFFSVTRDLR